MTRKNRRGLAKLLILSCIILASNAHDFLLEESKSAITEAPEYDTELEM